MSEREKFDFLLENVPRAAKRDARKSRTVLRVSLLLMMVAVVGFAILAPSVIGQNASKVSAERLQAIANATAEQIVANGWTAEQGRQYALRQARVGQGTPKVAVSVQGGTVQVGISMDRAAANPFAEFLGLEKAQSISVTATQSN